MTIRWRIAKLRIFAAGINCAWLCADGGTQTRSGVCCKRLSVGKVLRQLHAPATGSGALPKSQTRIRRA